MRRSLAIYHIDLQAPVQQVCSRAACPGPYLCHCCKTYVCACALAPTFGPCICCSCDRRRCVWSEACRTLLYLCGLGSLLHWGFLWLVRA
jgi:hypothetical protein